MRIKDWKFIFSEPPTLGQLVYVSDGIFIQEGVWSFSRRWDQLLSPPTLWAPR